MNYFKEKLQTIKDKDEYRDFRVLESFQDTIVSYKNKEFHLMGSNNYLSLNNNKQLNKIAKEVVDAFGTGAGGSRLTTGTSFWHEKLEDKLTKSKNTESSLVFGSGYMANLGAISGLTDKTWTIFSDKYNHASIVDGINLSGAKLLRYNHRDINHLKRRLRNCLSKNKMIITDSVFSMDGTVAPIAALIELSNEFDCILVVDDAHGFGVLGENGMGISEYLKLEHEIDLTIGSFSKAVPSSGGYVTGKNYLVEIIKNQARSFIYSTALPPHIMAINYKAIEIIESEKYRRIELRDKVDYFIEKLMENGINIENSITPIIPIIIGDSKITMKIQSELLKDNIFIPGVRPPSVPIGSSRLRASVNLNHKYKDLEYIASKIGQSYRKFKVGEF